MKSPHPFKRFTCLIALLVSILTLACTCQSEVVRTGYTTLTNANSGKCLDIYGGSSSAGAQAIQWPCNFQINEQWTVVPAGHGSVFGMEIVEQGTGQCLDVSGASVAIGGLVVQNTCNGAPDQLWTLKPVGANFQLINVKSGLCADVVNHTTADGSSIDQNACATTPTFLWSFSTGLYTPTSPTAVLSAQTGQCWNVIYGDTYTGEQVAQYPCGAIATNAEWFFKPYQASYEIISVRSGLCLALEGTASAPTFVQDTCTTNPLDLWKLTAVGGSYQVASVSSGLCINGDQGGFSLAACSTAQAQLWSLSSGNLPSAWSSVISLPVDPVGIANLPHGQVMTWASNSIDSFEGDIGSGNGQTYTSIFDPVALTSTEALITNTGADMFCPGTANLRDGSIMVNGGDSSPKTTIYSPATNSWASDAAMNIPRGYEGDTVLANGSVMTLGGSWSGGNGGKTAEVWTKGAGWTVLTGVPETNVLGTDPQGIFRSDNHLWMFSAANGQVFHAGPSAQMNWITTSGTGSVTSAGNRGDDPYAINGNAVMFDVGKIMKTGGAPAYQNANAEAGTYLINLNNGVAVNKLAPMGYPRAFANSAILPNGQVVLIGGQTYPVPFSDSTSILVPEIWDPQTQIFRVLNPMQTPRVYHSTAILLQDGRVFSGGGGLCGTCSTNHLNAEILTPPYLLNADGSAATRPVISSAPQTASLGSSISVTTSSPVVSFVIMRLSSNTHSVNNDQRRVPLPLTTGSSGAYSLAISSNPGIVLPGYYWLFALNAQGVPSVGSPILIN